MAALKFGQVFGLLMAACGVSALVVPAEVSVRVGTPLQLLFAPVTSPINGGAGWVQGKVSGPVARDVSAPASDQSLAEENRTLRGEVSSLVAQLEALRKLNSDRAALGPLRERCVPARITAIETGAHRYLQVMAAPEAKIEEGMAVITARGVLGTVAARFRGALRVKLTTDPDSKVQGAFVRFERTGEGGVVPRQLRSESPLVVGTGTGLRISNLSLQRLAESGVRAGDYLVVSDERDWPAEMQGFFLGTVSGIEKSRGNPLMAEVTVTPAEDPTRIKEVMILNR
jgi:hypothetical protein